MIDGMDSTERNGFFNQALADFTFDVACGAAIRHLMDSGYSAEQIHNRLDYPVSIDRIQAYMDKRSARAAGDPNEQYEIIIEYDKYGRRSYRKVSINKGRKES